MNFLQAIGCLIEERISDTFTNLQNLSVGLYVSVNHEHIFFVYEYGICVNFNSKTAISYDIANPEFDPEMIIDFIIKNSPGCKIK